MGTTDDCGFAPFSDDTSRTRETAFNKIRGPCSWTALASKVLGLESVQNFVWCGSHKVSALRWLDADAEHDPIRRETEHFAGQCRPATRAESC